MASEDTIAAISTPRGVGGIGIIRLSGTKAEEICHLLFRPRKDVGPLKDRYLYHGIIVSPKTNEVIDEVLISLMRNPHSYTGEDTLEINCHGGPLILETVLDEVIKAGARPALPGEFTKRAFLNNRIDLSQAEAVIDMISAKTERGLNIALSHLRGDLSKKIERLRESLLEILTHLEIFIDFTDDDIEPVPYAEIARKIENIGQDIMKILSTYQGGKFYRNGLKVLITGKPNVGKSSLLNRLIGEKRAIVTPIPGTTRDFIEESISIIGIPVNFIDTAGIRDVNSIVEKEGIGLVWEKAESADLILVLLDGSTRLTGEDLEVIEGNRGRKIALVINKSDLPAKLEDAELHRLLPAIKPLRISAKYGRGIDELKEKIYNFACDHADDFGSDIIVTNLRHKLALEKATELLIKARDSIMQDLSPELPAFDIRETLDSIGEILGITTNEDILNEIFSNFCIGK